MGSIIGGVLGGIGSLIGGSKEKSADKQAAQQSLTGYNYLTSGAGAPAESSYVNNGESANNAIAALLGVGGAGGSGGGYTQENFPYEAYAATHPGIKQGNAFSGPDRARAWQSYVSGGSSWTDPSHPPPSASSNTADANTGFNNYLNSTAYKFQLGQGINAINSSQAAKGLLDSGATAKALEQYGQNLAGTTFNNYLDQLRGLSAGGQTGLGQVASAGTAGGANAGRMTAAAGSAEASGINGALGSFGNALSQIKF